MALTKIDTYEVMYSANSFVPRIWLKGGNKNLGQLTLHGGVAPADEPAHQARTGRQAEISRSRQCAGRLVTGGCLTCCGSSGCISFSW